MEESLSIAWRHRCRLGVCPLEFLDALEKFLPRMKVQALIVFLTPSYYLTHWQMVLSNGCNCYYVTKYAKRRTSAELIAK